NLRPLLFPTDSEYFASREERSACFRICIRLAPVRSEPSRGCRALLGLDGRMCPSPHKQFTDARFWGFDCVVGDFMKSSHDRMLRMIAVFKFFKSAMLIALGLGAFRLLHKDVGEVLEHWAKALRLDPANRWLET